MSPDRVVVGVAGHAGSVHTLAWAIAETVATGARLVVVHATGQRRAQTSAALVSAGVGAPGTGAAGGASIGFGARGSLGALDTVDRFAASAVAAARSRLGESSVRIVVDPGVPGEVLVGEAGPRDILVIGGPPRSGWWVRSGTTNHVVARARCPVIVVHEPFVVPNGGPPVDDAGVGAALRGHVVVGLDGSGSTGPALAFGFSYADSHGLPVVAARVVPHTGSEAWIDDDPLGLHAYPEPSAAAELAAELAPYARAYPHVPVRRAVLTGRPDDALRRAGAQARLLVIGSGGTALHPLGVTCRSLVATADCPVAVIH